MGRTKNLLLVGAGIGLGRAGARRFASEGYAVHLIARSAAGLDRLEADLAGAGIATHTYVADATDHIGFAALIAQIDHHHPVDVLVYQPSTHGESLHDLRATTVQNVRANLDLLVLGAVAAGQALAPAMVGRGSGTLLFVGGGTAVRPLPQYASLGMAMAGLRSYALTLHTGLAGTGVQAAYFGIDAPIASGQARPGEADPAVLADRLVGLVGRREVAEVMMSAAVLSVPVPEGSTVTPAGRTVTVAMGARPVMCDGEGRERDHGPASPSDWDNRRMDGECPLS